MVTRKSNREIELMRVAGKIVAMAHKAVKDNIKPGMTTKDIDDLVEKVIRENDAIPSFKNYNGYPASACVSINEEVVHGIPSPHRVLQNGDIVSVDIGAMYKGYHGDSAWTYACGEISEEAKRLLEGTKASLFAGLEFAKANNRLSDISHHIQKTAEGLGFSVVREFVGHGVGSKLHEDPQIPNYGLPNRGVKLKSGMTLAIEPMINLGNKEVKVLSDGWTTITRDKSLSAHFEHTILIKNDGYEILTKL
ncbi:type I methionyl aminopeptidase [Candidatus Izemoplasma sp. B36]|uniref:type I methionyl aminopeptidase n=1 Tax=Candidatus Izemoplasma sp. B36 TaxID=3242468 RepID=UPI003558E862